MLALFSCVQETTPPAAESAAQRQPAAKTIFQPTCAAPSYPTPPPKTPPAIDSQCGLQGSGGEETNQNIAKNNFCATGTPKDVTITDFINLQTKVNDDPSIPFGDTSQGGRPKGPAVNRAPLQALGEGTLVRMQGYVLFDKAETAESVNCGTNVPDQPAYHDVHIELVETATNTDECSGIVSEMIPHHRPDSWTAENVQQLVTAKLPVRITGQLFFDSSHFSCLNDAGVGENPKRASLWEIHPIYKFEICGSNTCSDGTGWIPLDQWVNQGGHNPGKK